MARDRRALIFNVGTLAQRRTAARRYASAIALALGLWPGRNPREDEITRVGGGIHVPRTEITWRLYATPRLIGSGRLAGCFVLVVRRDDPVISALSGATLPVPALFGGGTIAMPDLSTLETAGTDHEGDEETF